MDAVVSFLFKYPSRVWARGDVVWSPVVPVWLVIFLFRPPGTRSE